MDKSVLMIGPHRQAHDLFDPLWSELKMEKQHFTSADTALQMMDGGQPPTAILVSYPLWDSSLDDLLAAVGRIYADASSLPVVILSPEDVLFEVAAFEDRGIHVISEEEAPDDLRKSLRRLLGHVQRAHPRFIVRMAVSVGSGSVLRACQSEDVSLSGMLILTSEEFPIGSQVRLEFALTDEDEPIACQAEVVRYTQPDLEKVRGMGVNFLGFEEDGRERLVAFLES